MTWSRFDDGSRKHPKAVLAGNEAWSFWSAAVQYSNQHLTDGFVPDGALATEILPRPIPMKKAKALSELLVNARLHPEGHGLFEPVQGGYQIHDFLDWNPSKADVEEKRRKERERKRGGNGSGPPPGDPPSNPRGSPGGIPRGSPNGSPPGIPPAFRAEGASEGARESGAHVRPRGGPRVRPAQPAQPCPTDPDQRSQKPTAKDLPDRAREEDARPGGGGPERIRCPIPIPVPDDALSNLEMAIGLPAHAARKAILDFSLAWYADDTDQRFPEAWIRSVVKALTSDWNDPTRRARMKAAAEGQVDEGAARARSAALKASHDARVARQTEEARAALARTGGPQERDPRKLLGGIGS